MNITRDTLLTTTLIVCALVTTGLVVRREFFPAPTGLVSPPSSKPVFLDNWRSYLEEGIRLGPASAPVQLIEFADFECPFCSSFHKSLRTLRDRYPKEVALSFIHYPLPTHRFAEPAARVSECAGAQGRFEAMQDQLFEQQDQFGLKPWSEFAHAAGVQDVATFETCIKRTDPVPRIETGKQLAATLEIGGTPTIIVNGWKLGRPPSIDQLDRMVKAVLEGKSPVENDS